LIGKPGKEPLIGNPKGLPPKGPPPKGPKGPPPPLPIGKGPNLLIRVPSTIDIRLRVINNKTTNHDILITNPLMVAMMRIY
jgi:hypothetical protein